MTGLYQRLLGLILLVTCQTVAAEPKPVLTIGLHYSAPWAYATEGGELTGIDYRLVTTIFRQAGYPFNVELFSHKRLVKKFRDRELDFVAPMAFETKGAVYTKAYLPFHDVAATHPDYPLPLNDINDLYGKRIVAYQGATEVLGKRFSGVADTAYYMEMADRKRQLDLLFSNRVEVVIGDRYVLEYFAKKYHGENALVINDVFPQVSYPAAAWEQEVVDVFNKGLQKLQQNGELAAIFQKPLP